MDGVDPSGMRIPFGKYVGELVTRLPYSYLRWACNSLVSHKIDGIPFHLIADAEIKRRGDRRGDVELSGHAIDRASLRLTQEWLVSSEGLYTWLERRAAEVYKNGTEHQDGYLVVVQNKDRKQIMHGGNKWVFKVDTLVPVLLTVMRKGEKE